MQSRRLCCIEDAGALDVIQGLIIMELQQINLLDYSSVMELLTHGTLCVP